MDSERRLREMEKNTKQFTCHSNKSKQTVKDQEAVIPPK